jgi:hypothetical protein
LEQQLVALEKTAANWLEPLKNWVFEANQAEKWVSDENWSEMKSFLKKVGSNRVLRAETLTVSFTKPWNSLAETVVALRDISHVSLQSSKWWRRRELNPVGLRRGSPTFKDMQNHSGFGRPLRISPNQ